MGVVMAAIARDQMVKTPLLVPSAQLIATTRIAA